MDKVIKDLWKKLDEIGYAFDFCFLENDNKTLLNIYYNPDSSCGGQIVVDTYPVKEIIMPYLQDINYDLDAFQWGDISGEIKSELYDMDNEDLEDQIIELVNKCLWRSKTRPEVLAPLLPKETVETTIVNENITVKIIRHKKDDYEVKSIVNGEKMNCRSSLLDIIKEVTTIFLPNQELFDKIPFLWNDL